MFHKLLSPHCYFALLPLVGFGCAGAADLYEETSNEIGSVSQAVSPTAGDLVLIEDKTNIPVRLPAAPKQGEEELRSAEIPTVQVDTYYRDPSPRQFAMNTWHLIGAPSHVLLTREHGSTIAFQKEGLYKLRASHHSPGMFGSSGQFLNDKTVMVRVVPGDGEPPSLLEKYKTLGGNQIKLHGTYFWRTGGRWNVPQISVNVLREDGTPVYNCDVTNFKSEGEGQNRKFTQTINFSDEPANYRVSLTINGHETNSVSVAVNLPKQEDSRLKPLAVVPHVTVNKSQIGISGSAKLGLDGQPVVFHATCERAPSYWNVLRQPLRPTWKIYQLSNRDALLISANGDRISYTFTEAGTYRAVASCVDSSGSEGEFAFDVNVTRSNDKSPNNHRPIAPSEGEDRAGREEHGDAPPPYAP